jgi:hypothetical protein
MKRNQLEEKVYAVSLEKQHDSPIELLDSGEIDFDASRVFCYGREVPEKVLSTLMEHCSVLDISLYKKTRGVYESLVQGTLKHVIQMAGWGIFKGSQIGRAVLSFRSRYPEEMQAMPDTTLTSLKKFSLKLTKIGGDQVLTQQQHKDHELQLVEKWKIVTVTPQPQEHPVEIIGLPLEAQLCWEAVVPVLTKEPEVVVSSQGFSEVPPVYVEDVAVCHFPEDSVRCLSFLSENAFSWEEDFTLRHLIEAYRVVEFCYPVTQLVFVDHLLSGELREKNYRFPISIFDLVRDVFGFFMNDNNIHRIWSDNDDSQVSLPKGLHIFRVYHTASVYDQWKHSGLCHYRIHHSFSTFKIEYTVSVEDRRLNLPDNYGPMVPKLRPLEEFLSGQNPAPRVGVRIFADRLSPIQGLSLSSLTVSEGSEGTFLYCGTNQDHMDMIPQKWGVKDDGLGGKQSQMSSKPKKLGYQGEDWASWLVDQISEMEDELEGAEGDDLYQLACKVLMEDASSFAPKLLVQTSLINDEQKCGLINRMDHVYEGCCPKQKSIQEDCENFLREEIDDPTDRKPDGYDDIPPRIPDLEAEKPGDWNSECDGEWYPPTLPNPKYRGPWIPRRIANPAYEGKKDMAVKVIGYLARGEVLEPLKTDVMRHFVRVSFRAQAQNLLASGTSNDFIIHRYMQPLRPQMVVYGDDVIHSRQENLFQWGGGY